MKDYEIKYLRRMKGTYIVVSIWLVISFLVFTYYLDWLRLPQFILTWQFYLLIRGIYLKERLSMLKTLYFVNKVLNDADYKHEIIYNV